MGGDRAGSSCSSRHLSLPARSLDPCPFAPLRRPACSLRWIRSSSGWMARGATARHRRCDGTLVACLLACFFSCAPAPRSCTTFRCCCYCCFPVPTLQALTPPSQTMSARATPARANAALQVCHVAAATRCLPNFARSPFAHATRTQGALVPSLQVLSITRASPLPRPATRLRRLGSAPA